MRTVHRARELERLKKTKALREGAPRQLKRSASKLADPSAVSRY